MIHAYHLILPMYGFWLPNDPRGSWSDIVRRWELLRFGPATKSLDRRSLADLTELEQQQRLAARQALTYPPVSINGMQAKSIAAGFADRVQGSNLTVWACSILPEHTHLVIARHTYDAEQIANQLKGAATRQIVRDDLHPLTRYGPRGSRPPRMWSAQQWKVYLDHEQAIENDIQYVEQNPEREGKPRQRWSFVSQFGGLAKSGWVTYH